MAKIQLLWPGKTKEPWINQGLEHFLKKLRNYYQVNVCETRAARYSHKKGKQAAEFEYGHLSKSLRKYRGYLTVLDQTGRSMSSEGFADFLKKKRDQGVNDFVFIVGGAYGLPSQMLARADLVLSLSEMTFTHEMSRLILVEQLYRAASINAGSPYHH